MKVSKEIGIKYILERYKNVVCECFIRRLGGKMLFIIFMLILGYFISLGLVIYIERGMFGFSWLLIKWWSMKCLRMLKNSFVEILGFFVFEDCVGCSYDFFNFIDEFSFFFKFGDRGVW